MDLDGAAGDSETETGATGQSLTGIGNPRKGLEERAEVFLGYAGTVVSNSDLRSFLTAAQNYLYRGLLGGVANAVAKHVIESTPDQGWITPISAWSCSVEFNRAISGGCLEGRVIQHLVEEIAEIEFHRLGTRFPRLEAFQQQQLSDQVVEPPGFALDAIESFFRPRSLTISGELQGHCQTRERRAKLV